MATIVARHRVTLPISALVENTDCTFQGNMPDPDNCQCNDFKWSSSMLFFSSSLLYMQRGRDNTHSLS
jgi:hypothetical protein